MSIFDDIRRDREAGTPGPWKIHNCESYGDRSLNFHKEVWNDDIDVLVTTEVTRAFNDGGTANVRRIARVPELERIALAAEELAKVFPDIVGYLEGLIEDGCPKCGGDCSGANPPVSYCPMKSMNNDLARANAAIAKLREATA